MPLLTLSCQGAPASIYDNARTSTETLLALLQLLEQTEVPGNFGAHGCGGYVEGCAGTKVG
jgi:hypothetical protein